MLMHLKCIIATVLYVIVSTDAINCKGCVPLDIFTFDKVCCYTADRQNVLNQVSLMNTEICVYVCMVMVL
jgi:hypothetical protein